MKKILLLIILLAITVSFVAPFMGQNNENSNFTIQNELQIEKSYIGDAINKIYDKAGTDNKSNIAIIRMNQEMRNISSITDKKEWFIKYKAIINKYSGILDPPKTIYDYYTEYALDIMFRVVQAEVGDEHTFEQKCNVASVILNRIEHYMFSDEMCEILTADQFETVRNGSYKTTEISDDTILACEYAFMIEDTTDGCIFFDSNNALKYSFVFNDGIHNFYKLKGE